MNKNNSYIHFDDKKLEAIGYTNNTICELAIKFSDYLHIEKKEYKDKSINRLKMDEFINLLHKLESVHQTGKTPFRAHILRISKTL